MLGQAVGLTPYNHQKIEKLILDLPGNKVTAVLRNNKEFSSSLSSQCDTKYFPNCKGEFFAEYDVLPTHLYLGNALDYCSSDWGPVKGEVDVERCAEQRCDQDITDFFRDHTASIEGSHLVVSYKDCAVELYS